MKLLAIILLCFASTAMAGDLTVDVTAATNYDAFLRRSFYEGGSSLVVADTSGVAWLSPAAMAHGGSDVNTGIAAAVYDEDVGNIVLEWTDGDDLEDYMVEVSIDYGDNWTMIVEGVLQDVQTYTYEADNAYLTPTRVPMLFRVTGFDSEDNETDAVMTQSYYYNQCTQVYAEYHAVESLVHTNDEIAVGIDSTLFVATAAIAETDTVGYGAIGGTYSTVSQYTGGSVITMLEDGLIESITFYLTRTGDSESFKVSLATYNGVGGSTTLADGERIEIGTQAASGWYTVALDTPYAATSGESYWIIGKSNTGGTRSYYEETGETGVQSLYVTGDYTNFPPATFTPNETYTFRRSAYATYTK